MIRCRAIVIRWEQRGYDPIRGEMVRWYASGRAIVIRWEEKGCDPLM